jgi:hypothetical protein
MSEETPILASAMGEKTSFKPGVLTHLKEIFEHLSHASRDENDVTKLAAGQVSAKEFRHSIQGQIQLSDNPDAHCMSPQHDFIGFDEFLTYMASPEADAMAPAKARDMLQPMSNYFVSSSHNTYATGNQLLSKASIEPYRNVCESMDDSGLVNTSD